MKLYDTQKLENMKQNDTQMDDVARGFSPPSHLQLSHKTLEAGVQTQNHTPRPPQEKAAPRYIVQQGMLTCIGVWIVTCQALQVAWGWRSTNWEAGGVRALLHGGDGTSFSEGSAWDAHFATCELACVIWKNWHSIWFTQSSGFPMFGNSGVGSFKCCFLPFQAETLTEGTHPASTFHSPRTTHLTPGSWWWPLWKKRRRTEQCGKTALRFSVFFPGNYSSSVPPVASVTHWHWRNRDPAGDGWPVFIASLTEREVALRKCPKRAGAVAVGAGSGSSNTAAIGRP